MKEITPQQALEKHGISAAHQQMDNGELRFRLKKSDGTAYIRTEAGEHGAWQESHFHNHVNETYIVQSGWIAFAEQNGNDFQITLYRPGECFTTKPNIIHNVYMSANSVIHTVKHGVCDQVDRSTEGTDVFDAQCKVLDSEDKILANSTYHHPGYTAEYRHFDNLIWQAPAWVTAIFALSASALGSDTFDQLSNNIPITKESLTISFLFIVSATLLCLSNVMHRFRVHQQPMKTYSKTPPWKSASTLTQLVINVQGTALLVLAFLMLGVNEICVSIGAALLLALLTTYYERNLKINKPH